MRLTATSGVRLLSLQLAPGNQKTAGMGDDAAPMFRKKRRPAGLIRKRKTSVEDNEKDGAEGTEWQTLDELKQLQKVKQRVNRGVNVCDLLTDPAAKKTEVAKKDKPASGLTDATTLASELDLTNTFSKETNRRDEDAEMGRFIEEELAKRKGVQSTEAGARDSVRADAIGGRSLEEAVFSALPLLQAAANAAGGKSEEMLSHQMLSGIPEVDLGVEERIRNVEATEEAKVQLMRRQRRQQTQSSDSLIPSNVAVNFSYNNRQKVKQLIHAPTQQVQQHEEPVVVIGDEPRPQTFRDYPHNQRILKHPGNSKASDDYHFERFRKQIRR